MAEVKLIIGGDVWRGWEEVTITRSIEQAAGTFDLKLTDRWPGSDVVRPINPGIACRVEISGQPIIGGYIDDATETFEADTHELSVRGRDAAGDLVDCSAVYKSGEWKNAKLEDIASDLCRPFGVLVTASTSTGKAFESFRIQEGETVFETIERACRQRGLLVRSTGTGGLVIGSGAGVANNAGALALGDGGNVLKLRIEASSRERYSSYTVKGQNVGGGEKSAEDIAGDEAVVLDGSVPRYRPLIVLAEEPGDGPRFEERARWEQRVRWARGKRMSATVQGWLDRAGRPWRPGDVVAVDFPKFKGSMLIATVNFSRGPTGTLSTLDLTLPNAFDVLGESVPTTAVEGLAW